jgi:multicomponent Na+:H+ antiporter subunit E
MSTALWATALFALWVALSGKLDALHLGMGLFSAAGVALATRPLLALPPAVGGSADAPLTARVAARFLLFVPWLFGQVVVGSVQVALVVLRPRLRVTPRVVTIRSPLPHPVARLTLANAITLTPGTVTLDAEGDEYLVHALTESSARGVDPQRTGSLPARIAGVFGG